MLALFAVAAPAAAQSMRTDDAVPALEIGFGTAAAISGDQVLVAEVNDVRAPGAVYVYGKQDGRWAQLHRLTAESPAAGDRFGASIATSGSRLIVGSTEQGGGHGAAFVFEKQGDGWRQIASLTATGEATGDSLGTSVAIDGDIALVGAGGADSGRGAVYVFRADGSGDWTQAARIGAPGGAVPDDRYAEVVALRGGTAVVAAARADSGRGAVYLYRGDGWSQVDRIAPDSLTANARFGSAIALGERRRPDRCPGLPGLPRRGIRVLAIGRGMDAGGPRAVRRHPSGTLRQRDLDRGPRGVGLRARARIDSRVRSTRSGQGPAQRGNPSS